MCLACSRFTEQDDRLAALEIAALGQITDERRRNVRRRLKFELLQRLQLRQVRFLQSPRDSIVFALLELRSEQRFEIANVTLLLLDGFFRQARKLSAKRGQSQLLGVGTDGGLLQGDRWRAHCTTAALDSRLSN